MFTVIHFGCWYEYLKLVEKIYDTKIDIVIKWFFAICGFTLMIVLGLEHQWYDMYFSLYSIKINVKWSFWVLEIICLIVFLTQNKQIPTKAKWMSFVGLFYISLSFALFLNLRDNIFIENNEFEMLDLGKLYVCGIMFSIWINDTMAYLVGSFIGKTPLTKISPKKTWEGTIGGIIITIIVAAIVSKIVMYQFYWPWIFIAGISAIFGTLGDLLESKLKRMADVKDSGSFMPGHGGFLDRFDSLLIAVPAVWVYVYFFIQ